jgi:hypothetical protein
VFKLLLVAVLITSALVSVAKAIPLAHADQSGSNNGGNQNSSGTNEANGQNNNDQNQCGNQGQGDGDADDTSCDIQG